MRKLTEKELDNMTAAELAEHFRLEARQKIAERKQEKENARLFEQVATPFIRQGISFESFMAQTKAPASFREEYSQIEEKYRKAHVKSQEQIELEQLEREVEDAMGLSSQQQAEPTGYQGRPFISAVAWAEQVRKDRERRHSLQG